MPNETGSCLGIMSALRVLLPTLALAFALMACKSADRHSATKAAGQADSRDSDRDEDHHDRSELRGADEFEGRIIVPNDEAKPGDVTRCPYSGREFVVQADSPRLLWRGKSWVLCPDEPMDVIQATPEKYLDKHLDDAE
jgi:hypothetical protein